MNLEESIMKLEEDFQKEVDTILGELAPDFIKASGNITVPYLVLLKTLMSAAESGLDGEDLSMEGLNETFKEVRSSDNVSRDFADFMYALFNYHDRVMNKQLVSFSTVLQSVKASNLTFTYEDLLAEMNCATKQLGEYLEGETSKEGNAELDNELAKFLESLEPLDEKLKNEILQNAVFSTVPLILSHCVYLTKNGLDGYHGFVLNQSSAAIDELDKISELTFDLCAKAELILQVGEETCEEIYKRIGAVEAKSQEILEALLEKGDNQVH